MDWRLKHRPNTIKIPEENIGKDLLNIDLSDDFLDMTTKAQTVKAKLNKWDYVKLKSFWQQKRQSGASLVVQWLRLCVPNSGDLGLIPGQETRSHMSQLKIPQATTKTQHSQINK